MSQKVTFSFGVVALGLIFGLSIQFTQAWTNPTQTPPAGNVAGPLNTSAIAQTKAGPLTVTGNILNNAPSNGYLGLTGDLPGYAANIYPTLKTSGTYLYFSTAGAYTGYLYSAGMVASSFRDFDSSAYYLDPGGTSVLYYLNRFYGFGGPEYDINNSAYYVDPNNTSRFATVTPNTLCFGSDCRSAWPTAVTNPVTGTGSAGYIPRWTSGSALGNSPFSVNGSNYLLLNNNWMDIGSGGIFSGSRGHHFWPADVNYWYMRSPYGMVLQNNSGTTQGYLYHTSGNFGLLDANGSWRVRISAGQQEFYGNTYMPFFYDSANSTYYVDPASTSNVYTLYRAYGFNGAESDINNSAYYIDPNAGSRLATLTLDSPPTVGSGSQSVYGWGMGSSSWPPRIGGNSPYTMNYHTGLAFSAHSAYGGLRFYNQSYPNLDSSTLVMQINNNAVYATHLYDISNNAYYVNPADTSNVYNLYRFYGFNGREYDINHNGYYVDPSGDTTLNNLCLGGVCRTTWPAETGSSYLPLAGGTMNAGSTIVFNGNSNYGVGVGSASPNKNSIAVDTVETDPGGTLELNFYGGGAVHIGSGGTKPLYASLMYDGNSTSYYIDPSSTSSLYNVYRAYGYNGAEYDINHNSYYLDPSSNSRVYSLYAGNTLINWPGYGNHLVQYYGSYLYPGYTNSAAWNTNYYLAASTQWGLYTNTSLQVQGGLYLSGSSSSYLYNDGTYIKASTYLRAGTGIYSDGWVQSAGWTYSSAGYIGAIGSYVYPGSISGYPHWQQSVYLASHSGYGLYTNTGMYFSAGVYGPAFYYTSDVSLKKNVQTVPDALENVLKLHGVAFEWKEDGTPSIGLIAQEVEKVYPELVDTDDETGLKTVQYANLIAPVIEAIKILNEKIETALAGVGEVERQTDIQQIKINEQEQAIRALEKEIEILKASQHE